MTRSIGIFLFDEVEVLDFAGPFEVFSTASRVKGRLEPDADRPFTVFTVAERERPVKARGDLQVRPHFNLVNHPSIDVLIVPGGEVAAELARPEVIDWIKRTAQSATITASVCTGAFLLAQAGLLDGKPATTHWEDLDDLGAMFPAIRVVAGWRWLSSDRVVTSAGISAGLDMSLYLVSRLADEELAVRTARQMDYAWRASKV
jgi:transcriptional regulator GlxA family with amidase domain